VVGGQTGVSAVENATQVYDPATNTWTLLADVPTARFSPGVASLGGAIYAVGGNNGATAVNTVEKLTLPATAFFRIKNRWQSTYMHTENLTGSVQVGAINVSWLAPNGASRTRARATTASRTAGLASTSTSRT
jgi:hypothetical protein